ncbi:ATP-binding protein, partial [Streptomyces afghaniensis]|uniref:ATP-binding protein n=1 Tax=Streptomyces afghaniensis TaxID=66865 RepID=UPI00055C55E6
RRIRPRLRLLLTSCRHLRIEVTDTRGDRLPTPQLPSHDPESGRGLLIVDALADRWGVTPGLPPRKTVWAELTL